MVFLILNPMIQLNSVVFRDYGNLVSSESETQLSILGEEDKKEVRTGSLMCEAINMLGRAGKPGF